MKIKILLTHLVLNLLALPWLCQLVNAEIRLITTNSNTNTAQVYKLQTTTNTFVPLGTAITNVSSINSALSVGDTLGRFIALISSPNNPNGYQLLTIASNASASVQYRVNLNYSSIYDGICALSDIPSKPVIRAGNDFYHISPSSGVQSDYLGSIPANPNATYYSNLECEPTHNEIWFKREIFNPNSNSSMIEVQGFSPGSTNSLTAVPFDPATTTINDFNIDSSGALVARVLMNSWQGVAINFYEYFGALYQENGHYASYIIQAGDMPSLQPIDAIKVLDRTNRIYWEAVADINTGQRFIRSTDLMHRNMYGLPIITLTSIPLGQQVAGIWIK